MADKVVIGSDHGGIELKGFLVEVLARRGVAVEDVGCHKAESCDYPSFAKAVAQKVLDEGPSGTIGILVCGTGLGMSMTANRIPGIRAAVCTNGYMARMARAHNDANVLCLGERVVGKGLAESILDAFLTTAFEGGRHSRRVQAIEPDA